MKLDEVQLQQLIRREEGLRIQSPSRGFGRSVTLRPAIKYLRSHLLLSLLAIAFLASVLAGSLLVRNAGEQTRSTLQTVLGSYWQQRQTQTFAIMTASTFGALFVALLVLFFCGFCTIAQPLVFLVLIYKGLGYGFTIGMIYQEYGTFAIPFVACIQLPTLFFSALLLIYAGKTAFLLSLRLLRSTAAEGDPVDRFRMRNYCIRYTLYLVFCVLIALIDAALFYKLSGSLMPF